MTKLLQKLGLDEKMAKNFWAIIIVAFGGAIIYGLPYFRFDYYDAYLEVYHLTDLQMGVFGNILGVVHPGQDVLAELLAQGQPHLLGRGARRQGGPVHLPGERRRRERVPHSRRGGLDERLPAEHRHHRRFQEGAQLH